MYHYNAQEEKKYSNIIPKVGANVVAVEAVDGNMSVAGAVCANVVTSEAVGATCLTMWGLDATVFL